MSKIKFIYLIAILSLLCVKPLFSQVSPKIREIVKIAVVPKEKFHIYLLIGQSNMAGRGIVEPQDTIGNHRILRLNRDGDWDIAKSPLHFDKKEAGVGPGLLFAKEMLNNEDSDVVIGLVPCAAGGSSINIWLEDKYWDQTHSFPYNNTLLRTKLALKDGELKGILWHQGEADAGNSYDLSLYIDRLVMLIKRLREVFNMPDLPFIAGELPEYNKSAKRFNPILREVKKNVSNFDFVSASGFTSLADSLHLDSPSARLFGKRYAEKMKTLIMSK